METWHLAVLVTSLILGAGVDGYGRGAPDSACNNLLPRHGPGAQLTDSPFTTIPLQDYVEPGGQLKIRLETTVPSIEFKGFLVQAHDGSALSASYTPPVGKFLTSRNAKILSCYPGFQNAVTHDWSAAKSQAEVTWQAPPDFNGEVVFKTSFVKDYATYWVAVPSARVRVGRSQPAIPGPVYPQPAPEVPTTSTTARTTTTTAATTRKAVEVSTSPWSFGTTPDSVQPSSAPLSAIYNGCGHVKGCFGIPDNCVDHGTCSALVSYSLKGSRYELELWSKNSGPNSYVAVGFSKDPRMGRDSVNECVLFNNQLDVYMSFNVEKYNERLAQPRSGVHDVQTKYENGDLYCKFTREVSFTVEGMTFDLREPHHILIARGPASQSAVQYHSEKLASLNPVNLASVDAVAGNSNILLKLHGAFMVGAWMFAASLGILLARYFRRTWVGKQIGGKDLWFVYHRATMILVWLLTLSGFVIIFVKVGGWTDSASYNPHAVIGCITTGLAFIQPLMAYFRPHPGTSRRPIFNWAHWLVGNSAHILGIVCIFLAADLPQAELPKWTSWVVVAYVAIHAATHLLLSVMQCFFHGDRSSSANVLAMRDLAPHSTQANNYSPQADTKEDAEGSKFRKIVLAAYLLLMIVLASTVIAAVVKAPWS